jgi:hypothetical protein
MAGPDLAMPRGTGLRAADGRDDFERDNIELLCGPFHLRLAADCNIVAFISQLNSMGCSELRALNLEHLAI